MQKDAKTKQRGKWLSQNQTKCRWQDHEMACRSNMQSLFFFRSDSTQFPMEEDGNDEKEARANGQPFVFLTICDVGPLYYLY